ncbi:MAG TPA: SAM-dependent chlorinase/fluorinase, partial [Dehalococcoidia bacterium]|nr:SAM-dependent chlorinase/fluorinase [Dehalococcoidia bacterium]
MPGVITLLTDFGSQDAYVAAMKGVVLSIASSATLVDITHSIPPQDIYAAAFTLGASHAFFPRRTIHVVVVDPGVGTQRRALLLQTPDALFLAPDNGVLTYVVEAFRDAHPNTAPTGHLSTPPPLVSVPVPASLRAYALANKALFRPQISQTFHGRDIFAPVAAHLSLGVLPEEVGPPLGEITVFALPHPQHNRDRSLTGAIIHVDNFGNLITNLKTEVLPKGDLEVIVGGRTIRGLRTSYEGGG